MPGIAEIATVMMAAAQRRMVVTAANLSNVSTPSFHARRVFSRIADLRNPVPVDAIASLRDAAAAGLKFTGNALDIAAVDGGALLLREGGRYVLVNGAQLRRDAEGRLVDVSGRALQAAGGGDLVVGEGVPAILGDGTVLTGGQATARIGLFRADDGFDGPVGELPEPMEGGVVRQGYVVPSDVDPAAEMIELTKAGRLAETGARVFQIYDDLLGRASSKLGDLGR